MKKIFYFFCLLLVFCCEEKSSEEIAPKEFVWEGANIYFLLTDRFNNGDTSNDINFNRTKKTGTLRGFKGGDIRGITNKIREGYFTDLGINAIWMTPIVEQIHGGTDEGTGLTYGFHGYWTKDWTKIDPNFGTKEDLRELVDIAHKNGIRILLDAVINHTGPVTEKDPVWPTEWVRTEPQCNYNNYENTVSCTLVKNLPDIKTESNKEVALPPQLIKKWKSEGRYDQEINELNEFFTRTGYPKAPRFYIIKWLTDYITEFGIDGYRVDTVKHAEESVWQEFRTECDFTFEEYKKNNPEKVLDNNDFYLVGEVYNYAISHGKNFDFGDKKVNYFDKAFNSLINFELKWNINQIAEKDIFHKYDSILQNNLKDYGILMHINSEKKIAEVINKIGPEHLEIHIKNYKSLLLKVKNAGSIALGKYAVMALTDYGAPLGGNHILPTTMSSRYSSGLGVSDFKKKISYVSITKKGIEKIGPSTITLAKFEGLEAHAKSIEKEWRKNKLPKEENVFELKGKVSDLLPNAMFRVILDNGHEVVCVAAGKLRKNRIRVLQGDTVTVSVSGYDTSRGRIIFRG